MPIPKVSIITAVYNAEKYIAETIKSVQNQSLVNWEYIIADNGSSDKTAEIIKEFLSDTRIKYIYVPKKGKAIARNLAFLQCKGNYVANIDADDLWRKDKLEKQVSLIENNRDSAFVYTGVNLLNEKDSTEKIKLPFDLSKNSNPLEYLLTSGNPITHSSVLFKREVFLDNRYQDVEIEKVDEQIIYWKALRLINKVGFISEPLTTYRIHDKSEFENIPIEEFCNYYKKGIDAFFDLPNLTHEIKSYKRRAYGAMYYTSGTVGLMQMKSIGLSVSYLLKSCILRPNKIHFCIITLILSLIRIVKRH